MVRVGLSEGLELCECVCKLSSHRDKGDDTGDNAGRCETFGFYSKSSASH